VCVCVLFFFRIVFLMEYGVFFVGSVVVCCCAFVRCLFLFACVPWFLMLLRRNYGFVLHGSLCVFGLFFEWILVLHRRNCCFGFALFLILLRWSYGLLLLDPGAFFSHCFLNGVCCFVGLNC